MEKSTEAIYVQPKTRRGRHRVDLILDAAADLIVEEGIDTLTTNAVAKRAKTSIGSLYQFFPNKESILTALADRYCSALQTILDDALETASYSVDFSDQVEGIVDNVIQFQLNNLAFGVIFQPTIGVPADPLVNEVMFRMMNLLSIWAPEMSIEAKSLHAEICIRVMAALLPVTHVGSQIRPEGVAELKHMLKNYLTPLVNKEKL
ncbi:TetR/AcrR family transcriptional regulator [Alicyclobacillus fastidiosus]|uniref:TetR/AcrR family transcriptional regulator n=1 Tax=Alicyclobacillus fastidiosus TaxID=392011 RepID=A0ABV5AB55_9BACL|nr:TetR/AcrR family transcriptional regulator [Alicyclobacillus fastidiosus]WEH07770.1 TetR/AcrR family transcriptional regulator [Alicyclobacillus fastidiosus]